ncbi:MAG: hypothetical protein A2725_04260 [Candidatus Magasanikbacteria bacterium RIFCSPHIGHO2_01_FULL_33_34]|uniref:Type II secretion system protein GspG C-terminal domain-containing protein n=1 Tax=Candidatus Magasanikbacteria bacterium RIFCSPHIGHO2_01_FULL_33_34 TaxID=1798671 RepID=A0A1F6LHQ1_9BACT|nr:MAG: hypothetical protein A2725_04260 [Candidatus Magasanikbacteria bacterium RIFCSPHIGHO2_01_FULL_33_34]OGH65179.1 MAG: hypothetical protein A3B83_04020 [Candidatus Magasanikbacteria bacterium RIFCSPHIGHO2_02_FULL_33_17]OGH75276.1 MAG: hypothetical protein A3A89_04145 [Candidatus Magasanikbacteria bacterium RIFCSPLOWO2_01_FULL_33_34]OGH81031.1 MAG: hypothetical protein A3F93_00175 [Candidatus Magasanikbacteria bacterium RIFCSPLOWO2_12_FULL_34_7]
MIKNRRSGFTLIELLIVIAIIAILAVAVFVLLDPLTRFQDSRDAVRFNDAEAIVNAIHLHQVDNGGMFLNAIASTTINTDTWYMIIDGGGTSGMNSGCDDTYDDGNCDASIVDDDDCVDLDQLVSGGYLPSVPISPNGVVTWDDGKLNGDEGTGYALRHNKYGSISIQACESENYDSIIVTK